MLVTKTWMEVNYKKFNNEFWNGQLPSIKFKVGRSKHSWGFASYRFDYANDTIIPEAITISNYYDSPEYVKIQTLLHEMIHIADYTFHPYRFFKNGRRVSSKIYDAHGEWFMSEANRISCLSKYIVDSVVTQKEVKDSKLSEKTIKNKQSRNNNALICTVIGDTGKIFYFKTDVFKAARVRQRVKSIKWSRFNSVKDVKFYKFDCPTYANLRSCSTLFKGWYTDKMQMMNFLKNIKATTYVF